MKPRNQNTSIVLILLSVFLLHPDAQAQKKSEKPNIVFILADDLGWMDVTVNGSKYYDTPNLERLAKRGMVFSNAYTASPLCSPTRASILSGQYPARFHLTLPNGHLKPNPNVPLMKRQAPTWQKVITPTARSYMPLETITIAERLKRAGYTTGFIGKWHLGHDPYNPENQGFDYNVAGGPNPGPPNYFSPYGIKNLPDGPLHEYVTDRITDEAERYLEANRDTSFFLCLWQFAVHGPFQGKLAYVKEYESKVDPRGRQDNPIMAAMIKSMDESVGRVMDKLDELGLTDNTLIVFYSDNGGNTHTIIKGKSMTNNYPLRAGKGNIHEGGIKVPLIVSWPGKVGPGTLSDEVVTSVDFYPTLLEITGATKGGNQQLDGVSLLPVLTKGKPLKREAIYVHFPHYIAATVNYPATAVRKGNWKLIRVYGEGAEGKDSYELYNLKNDAGEQVNLASRKAGKVKKLSRLIQEHVEDVNGLFPVNNPAYRADAKSPMGGKSVFPTDKYPMY